MPSQTLPPKVYICHRLHRVAAGLAQMGVGVEELLGWHRQGWVWRKMPSKEPDPGPVPSPRCHRIMAQLNKRDLPSIPLKSAAPPHIPAPQGKQSAVLFYTITLLPLLSSIALTKKTPNYPLQTAATS